MPDMTLQSGEYVISAEVARRIVEAREWPSDAGDED